jgi:hypothetical protein
MLPGLFIGFTVDFIKFLNIGLFWGPCGYKTDIINLAIDSGALSRFSIVIK